MEAEDMVPWSSPWVTNTVKSFLPPPSYPVPTHDQSCKRLSQGSPGLLWLSRFYGGAVNRTYTGIYLQQQKISGDSF